MSDQSRFFDGYKLAYVASQYRPEIFKVRIEAGVWRTSGDDHVTFYENSLQNISVVKHVCASCLGYTDAVRFKVTSSRMNVGKSNCACFSLEPYQNFCYLRNYEGTNCMLVQFTRISTVTQRQVSMFTQGTETVRRMKNYYCCIIHFSMKCRRRRIWHWKSKPTLISTPTSTYITAKDYHVIEDN
jgi:hypothetical protein